MMNNVRNSSIVYLTVFSYENISWIARKTVILVITLSAERVLRLAKLTFNIIVEFIETNIASLVLWANWLYKRIVGIGFKAV